MYTFLSIFSHNHGMATERDDNHTDGGSAYLWCGSFVTVRLVIRRRRRRSADIRTPVEIEELSSLSTMVVDTPATPVSPRRRRKPGSMESVELFSVTKLEYVFCATLGKIPIKYT